VLTAVYLSGFVLLTNYLFVVCCVKKLKYASHLGQLTKQLRS